MSSPEYLVPGDTTIEKRINKSYWDVIIYELVAGDYNKLCEMLQKLSDLTLAFIPSRKDLQEEFLEHVDVDFLKQQFTHKVFYQQDFITLFTYWIDWAKRLGAAADDHKMDELRDFLITETANRSYIYVLPYCYDQLYNHLLDTYEVSQKIKLRLKNIKN